MQTKLSTFRWGIYALAVTLLTTSSVYVACSNEDISSHAPLQSVIPDTATPYPTQKPYPTSTPYPTIVIIPSPTRAIPTSTPYPTMTAVPPTATRRPFPTSTPPLPTPTVSTSVIGLIKSIRPAVVLINTELGSGSGVIFQTDEIQNTALILTNYHVIEDAGDIHVLVNDTKEYGSTVVGIDPVRDLAVLEVCCDSKFESLELGDESDVAVGDEVIAMGYTIGRGEDATATVTEGIVSSKRYWQALDRWEIQTDINVSPNSSGGPLLSASGQILGINTWVLSQYPRFDTRDHHGHDDDKDHDDGWGHEGFGFAVSVESIREQLPDLISDDRYIDINLPKLLSGSYGPINGSIKHDPDCICVRTFDAGVVVSDAIMGAKFFNPYSASEGDHGHSHGVGNWDYGFIMRSSYTTNDTFHALIIRSDGWWYHVERIGNVESYLINSGKSEFINTQYNHYNKVNIMMIGEEGWLFVNDQFVTTLDLNSITKPGRLLAFTGYSAGDSVTGFSTMFEGLSIRPIDQIYNLGSHNLIHDSVDGQPESIDTQISLSDGLLKVNVSNPYSKGLGGWDYGVLFRHDEQSYPFYSLIVDSEGIWRYLMHTDEGYHPLSMSSAQSLNTAIHMTNNLALVTLGNKGWFFINGELLSVFDIHEMYESPDVFVATGLLDGNEISGEYTRLADLGIWGAR